MEYEIARIVINTLNLGLIFYILFQVKKLIKENKGQRREIYALENKLRINQINLRIAREKQNGL